MSEAKSLLSADRQARIDALDVSRSFIIQAPAGSGKTELLIQRYLALLSTVDHPEEIIAITFTRKAAAEMQLRVLQALRRRIAEDKPTKLHELKTYELAGLALDKSKALHWNLMGNPRRMRIQTLDALNASIARARPLSSSGAGSRIVVGAELKAIHKSAALATLDWLAEKGAFQAATVNILKHVDNNTWLYASYLAQMLGTRDQWLPFVGTGLLSNEDSVHIRERFEDSLEFAVTDHLQRSLNYLSVNLYTGLSELLPFAGSNMVDSDNDVSAIRNLADLSELPAPTPHNIQSWQGIAELLLTQKGLFRKKVDKRQGFPAGSKAKKEDMHSLLELMASDDQLAKLLHGILFLPPIRYTDEQWQVLLALFRLLPLAVTELKRLFNERGISDHIDTAIIAGAALGDAENPGDIALLLDHQVKHLLVDEMQDTSSAQYRMLETLTAGWEVKDGRTLYCVGDPMQSIYRFRNAEVGQFLLAKEYGLGGIQLQPLLLRQNFRSGANLVDWFNLVFPNVLSPNDDPLRGAVSYAEAVPADHLAGQGACFTHAVFGADSAIEAVNGCRVIAETLDENPDDDMAVLVRGRTQLPQLLAELRAAGIAYRAIEIDRLTDLPEIIDTLALTRAAVHQGDRIAWLGLLRAPWIGLHWKDLHALVRNDKDRTVWELLEDETRLGSLSTEGRAAIKRSKIHLRLLVSPRRSQSLRDLIERVWFALGGPGTLSDEYTIENVYRYFNVLASLERAGTLMDVGELEAILDLERVSNNDSARLQIMTMHRAKGLQFDHVLLYGLGRQSGKGDRRVLSWFDMPVKRGTERKVISPVGARAEVDNDPVHHYIELTEAEKDANEQARLLYVACTRAKKSLHLMGNTLIGKDGDDFRPPRSDSLLHLLWPAVEAEFVRQFERNPLVVPEVDRSVWVTPKLRRFENPWVLPSVARLPGISSDGQDAPIENEVEFYWVGNDARIAGTLVHRWLQLLADSRVSVEVVSNNKLRGVTERWLHEAGIKDAAAEPIVARVESAVNSMLHDEKGRWILNGTGHAELALSGVHNGEVEAVILDRVRVDESGVHWIIDYKTSSHEGGNLAGFLQVECNRYRPQLQRYASIYSGWCGESVKCALYFPLLKEFVEVPV